VSPAQRTAGEVAAWLRDGGGIVHVFALAGASRGAAVRAPAPSVPQGG
jgi:hypothetical protein